MYMCDVAHFHVWHDSFMHIIGAYLRWPQQSDYSYVWSVLFACVTWLMYMCDVTPLYVWHDLFMYIIGAPIWTNRSNLTVHLCNVSHSHVWHDSSTCVTWLIHAYYRRKFQLIKSICLFIIYVTCFIRMCDMTHSCMWHDSFMQSVEVRTNLWYPLHLPVHMCDVSPLHVWHDSFMCVTWRIHAYPRRPPPLSRSNLPVHMCDVSHSCMTWLMYVRFKTDPYRSWASISADHSNLPVHMCDVSHSHAWHDSFMCVTWLITYRKLQHQSLSDNHMYAACIYMYVHVTYMYISNIKNTCVCVHVCVCVCIHTHTYTHTYSLIFF